MSASPETIPTPALSLSLANFRDGAQRGGWDGLLERAEIADRAQIDRLVVVDHVVMGVHIEEYDGGTFPTGPDGQWLEPLTTLSVIAGRTSRIRLSTGIILAALRRPVVLAKALATLDVLSGGRVDLGVGVGWQREEYEAAGLPFEQRGRLLDESLDVMKTLWRDTPAAYSSERFQFSGVYLQPKPLQAGGVPIWVSGRVNKRTLDRIVRFGDGWIPWGEYRADVLLGITQVQEALAAAGRDPRAFQIRDVLSVPAGATGADLEKAMAIVPDRVALGITEFNLATSLPAVDEGLEERLGEIVAAFRAATA
jgi:probable F420-dependent oxidoreductase